MHDDLQVTLEDLYTLMIILSDNTATNILIKHLGIEQINRTLHKLGLTHTKLNRLLFDSEQSALGIENYISAREIGNLLEEMYYGRLISQEASVQMLHILKKQRLNSKIPFLLPKNLEVAHKTGEDTGITHDVGIVFAKQPFIVCFCGNEVDVPLFERKMQDLTNQLLSRPC
jgi:beta-lactamase class A